LWPEFWRNKAQSNVPLLALFIGTILSISALPVIARILMDLNLMQTELGAIVMSAAMLDDMAGWGLFAVILSNFGAAGHSGRNWWASLVAVLLVFGLILNLSNKKMQRAVGWLNLPQDTLQTEIDVPGVDDRRHLFGGGRHARHAGRVSSRRGAGTHPGLKANFVANFDLRLVGFVLVVACAGKISGVFLGATLGGKKPREALLVALGMNARGAVGIVLTTVALEYGLIDQRIFVALIFMALATSVLSAVGIKHLLGRGQVQPHREISHSLK
jgi:Kef-type K+ transport system membrane component KefB